VSRFFLELQGIERLMREELAFGPRFENGIPKIRKSNYHYTVTFGLTLTTSFVTGCM
jgi:hypothetical protein